MNFKYVIPLLLVLTIVSVSAQQKKLPTCEVTIVDRYKSETKLTVEVALTKQERTYGLMFRKGLDENTGMLFVYKTDQYLNFWMKNVSFPLSIAYIDSKGTIRDIQHMKPNDASRTYPSSVPVRYALEVNAGYFKKHKIAIGDTVILHGCVGK